MKRTMKFPAVHKLFMKARSVSHSCAWLAVAAFTRTALGVDPVPSTAIPTVMVDTGLEPVAEGKFQPSWESLKQYRVPEWFRDAKFGIWAHWGPQCQPELGDWYARNLYFQDTEQYNYHVAHYGHPSKRGFKDVIHEWKGEHWNPDQLLDLYRRTGAKYFIAMANHHDNFDNWDSKYQRWNSLNLGPKRDIIAGWQEAARKHGLKFGVSVHAAHAWTWYEGTQGSDAKGPLAGVPYDGKLTANDSKGTWWEGYDPQDLYEQRHQPSPDFQNLYSMIPRWNWGKGASQPDQAYCDRFYNRTVDLINHYRPELLILDDTALPLWPVSDAGLKIAAHFYNRNNQWRGNDGLLFGKMLTPDQRECMAWAIERGTVQRIEEKPWQADTCLGNWHYRRDLFEKHQYKNAKTIIQSLVDIVSKNGNLLLNVPVRGDGTLDPDEIAVLEGIGGWMETNQEAIHGTRPWKVAGEGPQIAVAEPSKGQGFNEGKSRPYTSEDIRFTTKGNAIYVFVMSPPTGPINIRSLGIKGTLLGKPVARVELLGGHEQLNWRQTDEALVIEPPKPGSGDYPTVFRIRSN
jgi:alpha-L-fucosidase